jgi:hypothetical protein
MAPRHPQASIQHLRHGRREMLRLRRYKHTPRFIASHDTPRTTPRRMTPHESPAQRGEEKRNTAPVVRNDASTAQRDHYRAPPNTANAHPSNACGTRPVGKAEQERRIHHHQQTEESGTRHGTSRYSIYLQNGIVREAGW